MPALSVRSSLVLGAALVGAALLSGSTQPAAAITMKECGTQFQDAKNSGTLNGQDWNAFRAAHCAATPTPFAAVTTPAGVAAPAATAPTDAVPPATAATTTAAAAKAAPAQSAAAGNAVFPDKIAPKYASLKAGTARRKTCDDQYKLNKTTGGNAGLPWNQKGGGYYSACNKHLKSV